MPKITHTSVYYNNAVIIWHLDWFLGVFFRCLLPLNFPIWPKRLKKYWLIYKCIKLIWLLHMDQNYILLFILCPIQLLLRVTQFNLGENFKTNNNKTTGPVLIEIRIWRNDFPLKETPITHSLHWRKPRSLTHSIEGNPDHSLTPLKEKGWLFTSNLWFINKLEPFLWIIFALRVLFISDLWRWLQIKLNFKLDKNKLKQRKVSVVIPWKSRMMQQIPWLTLKV